MQIMKQAGKKTKTDPELIRQIDSAAAANDPIQAVFSLDLPIRKLADPKQVEETATQVLSRIERESGLKPKELNIFRNLGSFAVSANPSLIRKLIDAPEIASAIANKKK